MLTKRARQLATRTAAAVAAALAVGAEALLRGGVTAAAHDPEALRAVQAEAREAPGLQILVRSCRSALLGQLGSASDDAERLAQAVRDVRCMHRVTSAEADLRGP
jgi:hypothetical protein